VSFRVPARITKDQGAGRRRADGLCRSLPADRCYDRRVRRWIGTALVASAAGLAGGCGPTSEQIGQAVLWASPVITLVVLGAAWLYAAAWRPLVDGLRLDPRPGLVVAAVQVAAALATLIAPQLDLDLVLAAVYAVGVTHLVGSILALRLAVHRGSRKYSWAWLAPWLVLYPPAVLLALFGDASGVADLALFLWIIPGYGGAVTAPIALLAVLEVAIRRSRARRLSMVVIPEARARRR